MTDIRDLLREAVADVAVEPKDPIEQVQRGLSRRRRSQSAVAAVTLAVAAAIAVPLTVVGSGSSARTVNGASPVLESWAPADGMAATGFGAVWALECCDVVSGRSWVDKLDPTTGHVIDRIAVPAPTSRIATGAGDVWVIGSNPGGGGPSAITAIVPTSLHLTTMHITDPYAEPYGIAFADGSAWVAMQLENEVWRLTPDPASRVLTKSVVHVAGGPTSIASTAGDELWVQEQTPGRLIEINPVSTRLEGRPVPSAGVLYGAVHGLPNDLLVVTSQQGMNNSYEAADPAAMRRSLRTGRACNDCVDWAIATSGQINDVVSTAAGAFTWETKDDGASYTYFLSNWDLHGGLGRTTARLSYSGPIAADSEDVGVLIGTSRGVEHWVPTGASQE
jgi:hypothetical protein